MKILRESIRLILREAEAGASCPLPTQDLETNTSNRNAAIKAEHIKYGPLNLADEKYWKDLAKHWNTTVEVAKQSVCGNCTAFDISPRMDKCMPGEVQDPEGHLGYCWMHKFKCHSARSCYTHAMGGPITTDGVSLSWQEKSEVAVSEGRKRRLRVMG
jgi:hypothetical protein